jgi:mono/diheme cytochrome c family protein
LDPASGAFKRVLTANFDGRGEKYQPGTCLVCHGGRPQSLVADTYPNSGDVGGTFLPWDLDSLLFTSDAEADFSSAADFAALRTKYSRTAQLDMLKRMNEAALSTYADYPLLDQNAQPLLDASNNPLQVSMQVPRDLLHRWYGYTASSPNYDPQFRGPFATAASYQDRERAAPDDWTAATTTNGISGTTLYHEVFARNCRSCHAQRVTDLSSSTGQSRIPTFARYQEFSDAFVAANGVPLGRDYVFSRGWMPAARLTDDRLWSGRQPSSGSLLASHFDLRDANQSLLRGPGPAPAAQFILQDLTNEDSGQVLAGLTLVGDTIRLDGRSSSFARDSAWQVTGPNGAIDVVGQHAAEAGFKVDAEGEYTITLVANNGSIASPAATESLRVPSQITFETKIYGLLQASCYRCHSPDGANSAMFALAPKFMAPQVAGTDYVATTYATLTGSTQFIDPANPTASPMLTVPSTGTRPSGGLHGPLWANSPQQQIARAWLNQGYPF